MTPSHAVIGGNSSCAVVGGETVDKFGKLLKPKPTDHFVAKPPPDLGSGEQVLTEFIPYPCSVTFPVKVVKSNNFLLKIL